VNPPAARPALEARGVTRVLPGPLPVTLVRDIDLVFPRGQFATITGPSGSGKSSLLYLLGLLDTPTEGQVLIDGEDTARLDADARARLRLERLGFVFQFHFLLPEFTVLDNMLIPMRRLGQLTPNEMRERAAGILAELGLGDHLARRPDQLSGGQRQRAAVARALANDPLILLADEPSGSLDTENSRIVFDILARLAHEDNRTVVVVTHELELAATSDRQIRLVDARIVEDTAAGAAAGGPVRNFT